MDERLLKQMAVHSFGLMLIVMITALVISQNHNVVIYAGDTVIVENEVGNADQQMQLDEEVSEEDNKFLQELGDKYIIIKKTDFTYDNIEITDLYMDRSIQLTFEGLRGSNIEDVSMVRVNQGEEFLEYPITDVEEQTETEPSLTSIRDPLIGISYEKESENPYSSFTDVIIELDDIYAPKLYQDDDNIYISLRKPKEVYDKIIVVDAGHGGKDPGTYSRDEQHYEKDINLSIVLYLKELLDREDIKVYYTRTIDKTVYLNPRVYLANDVEADFFVSVHCNGNESSQPSGAEVLFNKNLSTDSLNAERFAQICLDEITNVTGKVNRGLVFGEDVVIIEKAKMPVALIEVGFISNEEELNYLLQESNRKEIANGIYKAIMRAYEE
ncbi:MAG: hypothetical protein K0R92_2855 [Lachnospiraceae bacterium]|jgi:N-acetylmuramoyl-L-alanine amidase|nr:hypothetical protein [Lachnospiraceae bacterium]